jgi:hypothetical protein
MSLALRRAGESSLAAGGAAAEGAAGVAGDKECRVRPPPWKLRRVGLRLPFTPRLRSFVQKIRRCAAQSSSIHESAVRLELLSRPHGSFAAVRASRRWPRVWRTWSRNCAA